MASDQNAAEGGTDGRLAVRSTLVVLVTAVLVAGLVSGVSVASVPSSAATVHDASTGPGVSPSEGTPGTPTRGAVGSTADEGASIESTDDEGPTIENVTYANASVAESGNRTYLWQSGPDTMAVSVAGGNETALDGAELCVALVEQGNGTANATRGVANESDTAGGDGTVRTRLGCQVIEGRSTEGDRSVASATTRVDLGNWTANRTGPQTLSLRLETAWNDSTAASRTNVTYYVAEKTGDIDGDQLTNQREVALGTNLTEGDTDEDGLQDNREVEEYETDPLREDTDGDGLNDAREINGKTSPLDADTDGDGLSDGREVQDLDTLPFEADTDGDGLNDGLEVERLETDPTTADTDGDGVQDGAEVNVFGTDPTVADTDGDGVDDGTELRIGTDPLASDTDGDFLSDGRERSLGTSPTAGFLDPLLLAPFAIFAVCSIGYVRLYEPSVRDLRPTAGWLSRRSDDADADPDAETTSDEGGATAANGGSTAPDGAAPVDDATDQGILLTDEGRVLKILEQRGGRIQQGDIVEQTDWSKSKVSRLLSRMDEEDKVEKINVGRKNLIALPGHEPEGLKSPFEDRQVQD